MPKLFELFQLDGAIRADMKWVAEGFPLDGGEDPFPIGGMVTMTDQDASDGMVYLSCADAPDRVLLGYSGAPAVSSDRSDRLRAFGVIVRSPQHPQDPMRSYGGAVLAYPTRELSERLQFGGARASEDEGFDLGKEYLQAGLDLLSDYDAQRISADERVSILSTVLDRAIEYNLLERLGGRRKRTSYERRHSVQGSSIRPINPSLQELARRASLGDER